LTATNTGANEPPEARGQWPTYENMVAAFGLLTERARPGDQVYVHYSGHGGRTPTKFPDLKEASGLDESLVPTDIGNSEARYLRDLELATLLKRMVDKGLIVTLVLDSCHSGGATRGINDIAVRGIEETDTTPLPTESLVASDKELIETWLGSAGSQTRQVKLGSGWLPEPKGYVLLAACRPSESAYEYAFDGKERNGALTYWLLDALQLLGPGLSYKMLHDRILAKVHSQFEQQTPLLQGEYDRVVLGSDRARPVYASSVVKYDPAGPRVLLSAGQAEGVRKGAKFIIYPLGTTDFSKAESRIALAEVTDLGATESWSVVKETYRGGVIEQGAPAVLTGPASVALVRKVRLVRQEKLPATINQDAALAAVKQALAGRGWVEVAGNEDEAAEYQLVVNEKSEYEIWDRGGKQISNLRPPMKAGAPGAAEGVAGRLVHLTKYQATLQLDNCDPMSPLARRLVVELAGLQDQYDPADRPKPRPFDDPGSVSTIQVGQWTFLRIRNNAPAVLNVTVLDLQPDWGISQVFPQSQNVNFEPLDPQQEVMIPLQAYLPDGYQEGKDVLKVFATLGASNFRVLELPDLDKPVESKRVRQRGDALDQLLGAFTAEQPPSRNLNPAASPTKEWAVGQVELNISRQ
jgi:hypothetical protein